MTTKTSLLVLVHPGSLCGSADFNLGKDLAAGTRDVIAQALDRHEGHVLVVDGGMEDELDRYEDLREAIDDCLERAAAAGHLSERFLGPDDAVDDEHFTNTLPTLMPRVAVVVGTDASVKLTGAWYHPEDGGGCVGAVRGIMKAAGFRRLDVMDETATLEFGEEDEDDMDLEEEDAAPPAPRP